MAKSKSGGRENPPGNNRFHIDVRSDMTVGDIEWAKTLFLINAVLQRDFPHIEAHLQRYAP